MADKRRIWMAMKKMDLMKVLHNPLHVDLVQILLSVIYPVDFKTAGHIVDDVS
jgi:hypothetical protein